MKTIADFQAEQKEWTERNFGVQEIDRYHLGLTEEIGELAHHQLKMEQNIRGNRETHLKNQMDSIGDITIFLSGFCTTSHLYLGITLGTSTFSEFQRCIKGTKYTRMSDRKLIRRAAKYVAKSWNLAKRVESINYLVICLAAYCEIRGWDFQEIVDDTWARVSKRNWKQDPNAGGES